MKVNIRQAVDNDKEFFAVSAVTLSNFNRSNHNYKCKYDDYKLVINSVQREAEETFNEGG